MVAPAEPLTESLPKPPGPRVGTFSEPPCPLTPELRSDIAYRRAQGHPWDAIGASLHYAPTALRHATENDPDFAAAQEKAWAEATWEGEAAAMSRLRRLLNGDDSGKALAAAEVLVRYARERRRDDTRLAVEKLRADTQRVKAEARSAKVEKEEPRPRFEPIPVPTAAEMARTRAQNAIEAAANGAPHVYLWGGKHHIGREVAPDESDLKVRVIPDWSAGCGSRGTIYWVVPESIRERTKDTGIIFTEDNPDPLPWAAP